MIDDDVGATLEQAIKNVAMNNLLAELREAVVVGPKVLGDIYKEFERLQKEKEDGQQEYVYAPYPKP